MLQLSTAVSELFELKDLKSELAKTGGQLSPVFNFCIGLKTDQTTPFQWRDFRGNISTASPGLCLCRTVYNMKFIHTARIDTFLCYWRKVGLRECVRLKRERDRIIITSVDDPLG